MQFDLFPWFSQDIELLERINHGILVLVILAYKIIQIVMKRCAIVSKIIARPKTQQINLHKSIRARLTRFLIRHSKPKPGLALSSGSGLGFDKPEPAKAKPSTS